MPKIYLCFVWHMHQPCYKDLVSKEYRLPWTRMHALKDYYGMVKILDGFPAMKQTFNLVPSLIEQVEDYAQGSAVDPFLRVALKPAEDLTEAERDFILRYFFQANPIHLIARYPRYAELQEAWRASNYDFRRAHHVFNPQALRDLQVVSQLAWFEEEFLANDAEVKALVDKGRGYSHEDQELMGRKQREILSRVIPVYRDFAARGQIEISATPYYHPILPLICDSDIAHVANAHVPLPPRFRYPEDARLQLERSRDYVQKHTGKRPVGLWPSEGSVSDEALEIAADCGYQWAATDNGVLGRTLGRMPDPFTTYRPYHWRHNGRQMKMIFRDHYLSDLVGFVYSKMAAEDAAVDFVQRIRENSRPLLNAGRDALVPVVLDGENAWEHYYLNGRPFLSTLYERISEDPLMKAVTVSEAFDLVEADPLDHIFPGSWISANFDVWIGFDEDNKAWELLLHARRAFGAVKPDSVPEADYKLAQEELLVAEGSDWCWWYGPHHHTDNREEFDQLFRDHLANVYRLLRLTPPSDLSRPIIRKIAPAVEEAPVAPVNAQVDGEVTSYFEWLGAGLYKMDSRQGSMHGHRFLVKELRYGANDAELFLRVDFLEDELTGLEVRFTVNGAQVTVRQGSSGAELLAGSELEPRVAWGKVLELGVPFDRLKIAGDDPVRIQVSVWQEGLPMDSLPQDGWIEFQRGVAEWVE